VRIFRFEVKVTALERGVLNPFTGPQIQALLLNMIRQEDPSTAERLHEEKGIKPYAVRPLRPLSGRKNVVDDKWLIEEGRNYSLSFSALIEELGKTLTAALTKNLEVTIGRIRFAVNEISVESASIDDLLRDATPARRVLLKFLTPTHFRIRSTGAYMPFPLPHLMYTNLANVWNALYPYKVDIEEFANWIYGHVVPRAFEGKTREVWIKDAKQAGFKGKMEIVVRDPENKYAGWIHVLTRFAEFANTGAHRTMGMGVIKISRIE